MGVLQSTEALVLVNADLMHWRALVPTSRGDSWGWLLAELLWWREQKGFLPPACLDWALLCSAHGLGPVLG